jgi:hypothetical protein
MRAEHDKVWLRGIHHEEDPERQGAAPAMGTIGTFLSSWPKRRGLMARYLASSFG